MPLLEVEVVPRLDAELGQLLVRGSTERAAGKSRERRVAAGGLDTVDVHVLDPRFRVVAAGDHVVVAHRLHPEVLRLLAGHGVETDLGVRPALVAPHLMALGFDDLWADVVVFRREAIEPHPRVFDEVVVDRNDLHVILKWHQDTSFRGTRVEHGSMRRMRDDDASTA